MSKTSATKVNKKKTTSKVAKKTPSSTKKVEQKTPETTTSVSKNNKSIWWAVILLLIFIIAIPLISNQLNNSDYSGDDSSMVDENYDVEINMKNFEFSQTAINASRGETIKIKVYNEQGAHNFAVPELKINSGVLKEGESKIVEIAIPEDAPESYEFASTFDNNDQLGMVGTIVIGE